MEKSIKIKNTRMHKTALMQYTSFKELKEGTNEVPVAEAKLVLVECKNKAEGLIFRVEATTLLQLDRESPSGDKYLIAYKPILISETEKIEVGDWFYWAGTTKQIQQSTIGYNKSSHPVFKVLALPEHFSPKHLQAIVDGKLKDGDKVLVECYHGEEIQVMETDKYGKTEKWQHLKATFIKLNSSNHITLHKVEEKMVPISLLKEAFEAGKICYQCDGNEGTDWNTWFEWFETNIK